MKENFHWPMDALRNEVDRLKINKLNSLHLARRYGRKFVRGHGSVPRSGQFSESVARGKLRALRCRPDVQGVRALLDLVAGGGGGDFFAKK